MKKFFLTMCGIASCTGVALSGAGTVHADTGDLAFNFSSLKSIFESHIQNDRQNAANNRDSRNTLLQSKTSSDAADQASSTEVMDSLSLSLSNLENIESRIDARAAEAAGEGYDISTVTGPLSSVNDALDTASTSIAAGNAASTTDALVSAKVSLGEALDALKPIVGN